MEGKCLMFNIQSLIDDVITASMGYKASLRDDALFSVSDAGNCYRMRVYKRIGIKPTREIPVANLRKMMAGESSHTTLQTLLKRQGKLFLAESELETEHLKGHPDGVIKNGVKALLEIKTIEKFQMGYIKKEGAKRPHELQMFTYWVLLRKELKDLDHAILSYVKREDFEAHDFYYKWSDEIQKQVDQEWNPLIKHWNDKTLPECTCEEMYNGNGIKYCRYATSEQSCCDESLWKGGI